MSIVAPQMLSGVGSTLLTRALVQPCAGVLHAVCNNVRQHKAKSAASRLPCTRVHQRHPISCEKAFCKNEVSQGPVNSLFVSAGKSLANLVGSSHSSGQEQQQRQQWWSAVAAIMGHAVQFHGNRT